MIVRVSGEGQYRLPDGDAARLNELDNRAVAAVEQGDETGFRELWSQMLELVCDDGNALDDEELVESDVILLRATSRSPKRRGSSRATA